jgi:putative membrane-bound dehydrogenase-like protein
MNRFLIALVMLGTSCGICLGQAREAVEKLDYHKGTTAPNLSPQEALKAMTTAEGFKVSLFAGEPDVMQPKTFCIDERGRLWVGEDYSYAGPGSGNAKSSGKDRILIFEDTDGDGDFDSRKVFFEGPELTFLSGIQVGFGGVWVGAAPNLLFIPDKDGDDKPDGPPQVLLDGFGRHDMHETLNTFLWGPDGWLYGCQGIFVQSKVGKPGTPDAQRVPMNGAVFRYHPTKHVFEIFIEGGSNPWGIDWDENGQILMYMCVIPRMWHVVQHGRYHRQSGQHFNKHTYDDIKTIAEKWDKWTGNRQIGGQAFGGIICYQGDSFPEKYREKLFTMNLHKYSMYVEELQRNGSSFKGKFYEEPWQANDRIFLGFALAMGPDGSLFCLDWYDRQTCHGQSSDGKETGRIYRLSYGDAKQPKVDLKKLSSSELVKLHLHRNEWHVRTARRILQERGADEATHAELRGILNTHADGGRKLRAMWTLRCVDGLDDGKLVELLKHENEHVRGYAVQFLAEDKVVSPDQLRDLERLAR